MNRSILTGVMALVLAGASGCSNLRIKPGDQIVAMGDSITQAGGYLRVIDAVFAQQYPDMKIPRIINAGISGEKAEDMVKRFERDVIARNPNIVTISVGINDVWHRMDRPHDPAVLEEYSRNVDRMVVMAQETGARVILLSPTVIEEKPGAEGNQRLKLYIQAGQEIARRRKADYVNLHEMFLEEIEKRDRQRAAGASESAGPLTTDGVHMTAEGDKLMALGVLRALGVPDEKVRATDLSGVFGK
ncbi:MAG TPA: SGNH/GDSL hydrolase family protein [Phycisphaerae bacterium]|nr:SGNH/GDSL hydrolase family protein [Phycisphaerae bacterium]